MPEPEPAPEAVPAPAAVLGPAVVPAPAVVPGGAPAPTPVDPERVRQSFARLSALFEDMMVTVADLSTRRCPYRDRTDHCTAQFGCRNQRPPDVPGGLRRCGGDERLDYRSAWESR